MPSRTIDLFGGLVLVVATAAAASAQTAEAPIVSRPSNAAVSPNLSDLPTAHWSHSENPKVVPHRSRCRRARPELARRDERKPFPLRSEL